MAMVLKERGKRGLRMIKVGWRVKFLQRMGYARLEFLVEG